MKSIHLLISISLITNLTLMTAQNKIGIFDNHTDIGITPNKGKAQFTPANQTYKISGSGENMWNTHDHFHYLWTTLQGDFILRSEVRFLSDRVDPHRKAGWVIQNNLNSNSAHVNAAIHGDGLTSLQFRRQAGNETEEIKSTNTAPDVVQLERSGNLFILSTAKFGEEFTTVQVEDIKLDNDVYAGLYICSHTPDVIEEASFRNVRIIQPADKDFIPYRDYIGSRLEVMDIESGHRKILYESGHSIQAPNLTPDGNNLIFNSKGLLFTYHLEDGIIKPLNTGFANNNNNDHVLTFDGEFLGISHHNADDNGASSIYYLPVKGGSVPVKVTKDGVGASYLHGWSPDKQTMLFTGDRNSQFDIYAVNVKTGKEKQLTNQKTLDDGSEYSPDGKYIFFFNSVRTGKIKLWRMDADGKNQIQLTHDEYNDWFPHVSPDRKWIVFISFPKDIDPSDHPFYKHCLIRLMPYEGGTPKVIAYIYGGQGSINVPSWSPDSKRIAFVTNTQ